MATKTKEGPISFSGAMVRAILEGRKTMTRRVVKPRDVSWHKGCGECDFASIGEYRDGLFYLKDFAVSVGIPECPYGVPGDRLWVRETWATVYCDVCDGDAETGDVAFYRADYEDDPSEVKWRSPYHMPRWASRITLEVTGVRVERLQEITEKDALAEGAHPGGFASRRTVPFFQQLWDSINGKKHSWASNPWVWVVSFTPAPTGPRGD